MSNDIERELADLELAKPDELPAERTEPQAVVEVVPAAPAPPPPPSGSEPGELSGRARLLLGASIVAMTFLWAVPFALGIWLCALFLAPAAGAELMQEAGGLRPTTFGGAFWVAVSALGVVLGAAGWRAIQRLRDPGRGRGLLGRPGLTLTLGTSVAVLGVVSWESSGTDLPDTLVAALILLAIFGAVAVLPVQLGRVVWRTARRAWRSRTGPRWQAGLWTGLALGMALVSGLNWTLELPGLDGVSLGEHASEQLSLVAETWVDATDAASSEAGVDAVHEAFEEASERLYVSASSGFSAPDQTLFDQCVRDLMSGGDGRSRLDDAVIRLQRRGTRPSTAVDIAYFAVLTTCEKYSLGKVNRGVVRYFNAVVKKAAAYEFRRWDSRGCSLDAVRDRYADPSPEVVHQLKAALAAMCTLDPADQNVLRLAAQGLTGPEIAEHMGLSKANARKRLSRARQKLRAALERG